MIADCPNPDEEPDRICPVCDGLLTRDLWDGWFCPECEARDGEEKTNDQYRNWHNCICNNFFNWICNRRSRMPALFGKTNGG